MKKILLCAAILAVGLGLYAQDDFGVGFAGDDEGGASSTAGSALGTVKINGKAAADLTFFFNDFESGDAFKGIQPGNLFSGALNFSVSGGSADGVINLNLNPNFQDPLLSLSIDEAYVRGSFGDFTIEGGLRKLYWGRADSLGPLDVINPLDYRDLSAMSDPQAIKIARPLLHGSYNIGSFSKLEGVFVPWFEGHRFATDPADRWTSSQVQNLTTLGIYKLNSLLAPLDISINAEDIPDVTAPDTYSLEYTQGGLRFTSTLGPVDFGIQYYSGFLPRPAARMNQTALASLADAVDAAKGKKAPYDTAKIDYDALLKPYNGDPQAALTAIQGLINGAQAKVNGTQADVTAKDAALIGAKLYLDQVAATYPGTPAHSAAIAALAAASAAYQAALAAYGAEMTAYGTVMANYEKAMNTMAAYQSAGTAYAEAMATVQSTLNPSGLFDIAYNRYHQIGVDYAQVIWGFNVRAEFAAILTEDFDGNKGLVYNPSLAWSLGFDRDLFAGINLNFQANESIRLFHDQIGTDPLEDVEAGTKVTSTRITAALSRKFFRDELELRTAVIWGIEDMDCYLLPAVIWTRGELTLELAGGVFLGDKTGELGQYRDNSFIRLGLSYAF
jgi:hypothetical protein